MTQQRIVFFGTPDFAVPSLMALGGTHHEISLVVTQPDRPRGRGRKMMAPPVKETARKLGLPVAQPDSIQEHEFTDEMKRISPDFFVVVAFGALLKADLLAIPKIGTVNVHASLLPLYRGPAPIHWAIIKGESKTGVTTMLLDTGVDTGEMLLSRETEIQPDDTTATLHDRLADLGAAVLTDTMDAYASATIEPIPQNHALATYAPMLQKKDGRIDWQWSADRIEALIRGTNPWPGAFTYHGNKRLKIWSADVTSADTTEHPGTVLRGFDDELRVATGDGILAIRVIQSESGKRMPVKDFLRGYPLEPGAVLT